MTIVQNVYYQGVKWAARGVGIVLLFLLISAFLLYCFQDRDLVCSYNVLYGPDPQQRMDLYRLAVNSQLERPAIVFVHGGGWVGGQKDDFQDFAKGFAREGYVTATIDYRLSEKARNQYPIPLEDAQLAVRWLRSNALEYHLDANRVAVVGGSAGGHLVSMLGLVDTLPGDSNLLQFSSRATCVVDLFGPSDLTADFSKNYTDNISVPSIIAVFLGHQKAEAPDLYRQASPIFHIDSHSVPFLLIHGRDDPTVPVDQSQRLYQALKANGTEATLLILDGEGHGISSRHFAEMITAMKSFLKAHLNPP